MSTTAKRMTLKRASDLADSLVNDFTLKCTRIAIAGSIRRRCADVGDLELVAEPIWVRNLLGDPTQSLLDPILHRMREEKLIIALKDGPRYKQFELIHAGCRLDLFLCTADRWAVNLVLRTGPESFTKRLVSKKSLGGLCPDEMDFRDARLLRRGEVVDAPDEADVFKELGLKWLEPWERK
jgi:DNA polymerase/3'-5' exonuclease PolX